MRPILKYPGAKWRLANWIISHMPPHNAYVEPYFGSGAVFFNKEPCKLEVINDLNGDIVNYFRVMRDKPQELAKAIEWTPWERGELGYCRTAKPIANDVEMARRCIVRYNQSIGSGMDPVTAWRHRAKETGCGSCASEWQGMPKKILLASKRLMQAQIECLPALEVIEHYNFPEYLVYADPPYVQETRNSSIRYGKGYELNDADHITLLTALKSHTGMVLLSGYDCPMYRDMLSGWRKETITTRAERAALRTECLWLNPLAAERNAQVSMFSMGGSSHG